MTNKTRPWFAKVRGSYLPIHPKGWLTYIPFVLLVCLGLGSFIIPLISVLNCGESLQCKDVNALEIGLSFVYAATYEAVLIFAMTCFAKSKS